MDFLLSAYCRIDESKVTEIAAPRLSSRQSGARSVDRERPSDRFLCALLLLRNTTAAAYCCCCAQLLYFCCILLVV